MMLPLSSGLPHSLDSNRVKHLTVPDAGPKAVVRHFPMADIATPQRGACELEFRIDASELEVVL
ncbi:hypothetical protein [Methyloversatilis thermotolerans]|uniref:hypothetical protein n=1 Tax=Methyloversatilis thermotolerans TaxID=1346290 RepID=UPI001E5C3FB3|nr:hypothetical protein [Methyloversatilis thermotolerans]